MNALIKIITVATFTAAPLVSFAQTVDNQQPTRAQIRAELAALEKNGYVQSDVIFHPENVRRAERMVAEQNSGLTEYGSGAEGTTQSGK